MSPDQIEYIKNILVSLGPIIIGILSIVLSYSYNRKLFGYNEKALYQKSLEDEKKEIYKKLNDFYGPFLQLRRKSALLYDQFAKSQKEKLLAEGRRFRTLPALLEGQTFKDNDAILLKEIIAINKQLEDLIVNKAGLIDDNELRNEIIPRFNAHVLLIRLAAEGQLKDSNNSFDHLTFPNELDGKVEAKIKSLSQSLQDLNNLGRTRSR